MRSGFAIVACILLIIIIHNNVTFKKEDKTDTSSNTTSSLKLEINSELIQNSIAKLTLLKSDAIDDEIYGDSYFKGFVDNKKSLTNEEKTFIAFNELYKNDGILKNQLTDGTVSFKIEASVLKEKIDEMFPGNEIDFNTSKYLPSNEYGFVEFLYTGESFELKYKPRDEEIVKKARIESATKEGDYINIKIKAFYLAKNKDSYNVFNYEDEDPIAKVEIIDDSLYDIDNIDEYTFIFKLYGDNYYLESISKN